VFHHDQSSFALDILQNGNKRDANKDHGGIFVVSSQIALTCLNSFFLPIIVSAREIKKVWVVVTAIGNGFLSFSKTENKDISG
jgi:hypothetical protein